MAINLVALVSAKADEVANDATQALAAAGAMADLLRNATTGYLGGDLTFSGGGGTATITPVSQAGRSVVKVGGAYSLANSGRHQPAGARGGSWGGFSITETHSAAAFTAGRAAFMNGIEWGS